VFHIFQEKGLSSAFGISPLAARQGADTVIWNFSRSPAERAVRNSKPGIRGERRYKEYIRIKGVCCTEQGARPCNGFTLARMGCDFDGEEKTRTLS
jgi:hypothetical protein